MKGTIPVVLGLLLLAGPQAARAQFTYNMFTYAINADGVTATITGYVGLGSRTAVLIPTYIYGLTVTGIGNGALQGCPYQFTLLMIPSTVTGIGANAFNGCLGLAAVTIQGTLTNIGDGAFYGCSNLAGVSIPAGVINIGNEAFYGCSSLSAMAIPNILSNIGTAAFYGCSKLPGCSIPATVTNIGDYAFYDCYGMANLVISNGVTFTDGIIYGSLTGVTGIGNYVFSLCSGLTNVTFPGSFYNIGTGAFQGCARLSNVNIPYSVTNIRTAAFSDCANLTAISVDPENLYYTSVGGVLFDISQTTLIQYPPALAGNYSIPSGVAGIGAGAFRGCVNFTTETIPAGVTNIGDAAFDECINLTAFTVAPGNSFYSSAGGVLFDLNQATLIQYPAALAGNYAIPSTVTSIGDYAFDTCATLTNVTIPTGVTNISDHAFYACGSLTNAALPAGLANIGDFAFFLCSSLSNVAIPAGVTCIGQDAFAYCAGLTNATIANGVAAIGNSAFDNCSSLTSVTIPGSVTNIGNCAFYDCAALTNATIANGVISLGASAFSYCTSLAGVTIPASLTNIAQQAFAYCPSLMAITVDPANPSYSSLNGVLFDKSQSTLIAYPGGLGGNYTIPSTVTTLGDYAFYGCGGLVSVTIPAGVTNLGNCQFYDCFSLTNAIIGGGISRIGSNAFFFSSRLISVTFPASVYYIANAFNDNWTLTNLFFQGNPPAMGAAFGYWAYPPSPPMLYYLPGASGWSSTYDGYSTVLWNPLIQPGASGFGVKTNHFGFYITGTRNIPIVIEASTNLAGSVWTPLQTLRLTNGSVYFNDTYQPGNPARYYRIGSQ